MNKPEINQTGNRIRYVPIKRIPNPEIVDINYARTIPIKKLDEESRFLLHTNSNERTIKPGNPISPELNSRKQYSVAQLNKNRFDGFQQSQLKSNRSTENVGSKLYSRDSLKRSVDINELSPGIRLIAQYGVTDNRSAASTPSTSHPRNFVQEYSPRAGSLPTSSSVFLPSNNYYYHTSKIMPRTISPIPLEIISQGRKDDVEIIEARNEPDYHLMESGSDVIISDKANNVPEPAPVESKIGATSGTMMNVYETDILDSSCSSETDDDDVVKNCDSEQPGNTRGMIHDNESGSSGSEEDDREFKELIERELIVEKYERGPDNQVESWDDPEFVLYKVTDRYGFVHKTEEEIDNDKKNKEKDRIKKELAREIKWLKMIEEWRQRHPAKLPERIWKGVPEKLRSVVWQKVLRSEDLKNQAKPNLYKELLMRARLVSKDIRQIDLDINRTYRNHLAFRMRYDVKQQSLFSVLAAYAMYNTEIGYCQGMSQIAALFLMYMDEEDAFWCLHSLMVDKRYTMHGMFVPGFPKLQRFQEHYEKVLMKYLPKLKKHFDNEGIIPSYLTKWWFGCFLDRVPFPLALRVWDVFLYFGDSILIAMAYNIMRMHSKRLRKLNMEKAFDYIQKDLEINFGYSFDDAMESLHKCLNQLQSDRMALPHPAPPNAPSEVPTKPLGPILSRSMCDIRMDIAEVHSRGSRANSIAGKSPAVNRRRNRNSPLPSRKAMTPLMPRVQSGVATGNQGLGPTTVNAASPSPPPGRTSPNSLEDKQNGSHHHQQHEIPLSGSYKRTHPLKPVIPDQDGFVPMSPRKKDSDARRSVYDNVPQGQQQILTDTNVFGYGGHMRNNSNRSSETRNSLRHSRDSSGNKIRHTTNNVTYVEVGGEESNYQRYEYDRNGINLNDNYETSERLSRTSSAYQNRQVNQPQPPYRPVRAGQHSLKQRTSPGRYYFEPDPPGVVPNISQRVASPNLQHQQESPRHKHSYV